MVLENVFTPDGEEGDELRGVREEVRAVECGMGERRRDVRVFNGSEVLEPPEIESGVGERRIGKGEVSRGMLEPPQQRGLAVRGFVEMPRTPPKQWRGSSKG